ncbi:MAG: radical SAM protein [Vulcanimicrobiota bacterium]
MRLLLIQPRFPESFWSFSWLLKRIWCERTHLVPPLGLASVAALTPSHWQIKIVDENVEPINWDEPADIVGVGGMTRQFSRQKEILNRFRQRGIYTVAGGNHASLLPEQYQGLADAVVAGEAERIWPQFCLDFEQGQAQALYRETGSLELAHCPTPRFDLLKSDRYLLQAMQFSRGCPYRCEFCDIIVIYGRKPRTKSLEQIERELDQLRLLKRKNIFFVDDNLTGNKPRCKELLSFLADYQVRHGYWFHFNTQVTINLGDDLELMQLFHRANFRVFFFGIESPNPEALKETLKYQNARGNLLASIGRVHQQGFDVQAGFILGFDADGPDVFEEHFQFIQEAGITTAMVGLLHAIPRTPLWERLEREGRLRDLGSDGADNTGQETNIVPKNFTNQQLTTGYIRLLHRLFDDRAIYERLRVKLNRLDNWLPVYYLSNREIVVMGLRFLWEAVFKGGPRRWYYFLRSLPLTRGKISGLEALVIGWTVSISIQDYVRRTFPSSA